MSRTTKNTLKKSINNVQHILLDTNVVIDVLLKREPFANESADIFRLVESGDASASVCATTVTTVDYLVTKFVGSAQSRKLVAFLMSLCDVADVNKRVLLAAMAAPMSDFEDAVIAESAKASGIPTIITRNGKDFVGCGLHVYSPSQWLAGFAT
jgi:predicted nucleic acid-binding protein